MKGVDWRLWLGAVLIIEFVVLWGVGVERGFMTVGLLMMEKGVENGGVYPIVENEGVLPVEVRAFGEVVFVEGRVVVEVLLLTLSWGSVGSAWILRL